MYSSSGGGDNGYEDHSFSIDHIPPDNDNKPSMISLMMQNENAQASRQAAGGDLPFQSSINISSDDAQNVSFSRPSEASRGFEFSLDAFSEGVVSPASSSYDLYNLPGSVPGSFTASHSMPTHHHVRPPSHVSLPRNASEFSLDGGFAAEVLPSPEVMNTMNQKHASMGLYFDSPMNLANADVMNDLTQNPIHSGAFFGSSGSHISISPSAASGVAGPRPGGGTAMNQFRQSLPHLQQLHSSQQQQQQQRAQLQQHQQGTARFELFEEDEGLSPQHYSGPSSPRFNPPSATPHWAASSAMSPPQFQQQSAPAGPSIDQFFATSAPAAARHSTTTATNDFHEPQTPHPEQTPQPLQSQPQSQPQQSFVSRSASTTPTLIKKEEIKPSSANNNKPTECTNCKTRTTPLWRRNPQGQPLCNACGLFLKLHGEVRPLSLKTDIIKKRNRGPSSASSSSRSHSRENSLSTSALAPLMPVTTTTASAVQAAMTTTDAQAIPIMAKKRSTSRSAGNTPSSSFSESSSRNSLPRRHVALAPAPPKPMPNDIPVLQPQSYNEYRMQQRMKRKMSGGRMMSRPTGLMQPLSSIQKPQKFTQPSPQQIIQNGRGFPGSSQEDHQPQDWLT
ncbi:hypothetical protein TRVA0_012S01266 [Trichomonascus vanleenenianus]|uniref:GATA-type transcription factor n=1 Tax=Trichomonascus vanleenenianus TaxID=2268995 RepID=UPI003ECB9028